MGDKPHDELFQETFRDEVHAAAELRAILSAEVVRLFDWDTLRLESANLTTVGEGHKHADLLFSVQRRDTAAQALVFVLFEHQSSTDPWMPLRMLRYMLAVWERWLSTSESSRPPLPPILPVVLCHDPRGWRSAQHFQDLFAQDTGTLELLCRFVPSFELVVDDISTLDDEQLDRRSLPPGVTLTLWALRDGRAPDVLLSHVPTWAHLFTILARLQGGQVVVDRIIDYLGQAAGERSVPLEHFVGRIVAHAPHAQQVVMNSVEKLIEKGRKEGLQKGLQKGREQGREEGRIEGQRQMLLAQLEAKFPDLTAEQRQRIQLAGPVELGRYIQRIVTADSVDAVLGG